MSSDRVRRLAQTMKHKSEYGVSPYVLFLGAGASVQSGFPLLRDLAAKVLGSDIRVRQGLAQAKGTLAGLYEGQPNRVTDRPTATRPLKAFAQAEITLTRVGLGSQVLWHITPLSGLLEGILAHLGLPKSLYESLACNAS